MTCSIRNCFNDKYDNNGVCTECDNFASMIILSGSFLSFALVGWYSSFVASNRAKMMRLRVVTTFFQIAELTTLIQIAWPEIVYLTIPFQFPLSSTKCECQENKCETCRSTLS